MRKNLKRKKLKSDEEGDSINDGESEEKESKKGNLVKWMFMKYRSVYESEVEENEIKPTKKNDDKGGDNNEEE